MHSAVAIPIGLPPPVRQLVERRVASHVLLRSIPLKQDGGFRLEPPPKVTVQMIERFADEAPTYRDVLIISLPYASSRLPDEVAQSIKTLESLGAKVFSPRPDESSWPARAPALDNKFQIALADAIAKLISSTFPESPLSAEHRDICMELLRGLASHSKMGPNNHSHEDDLWKSRGQDLGPGERDEIVARLLRDGLLGRKKNRSAGGTGWVYWIADVQSARMEFPELDPYF